MPGLSSLIMASLLLVAPGPCQSGDPAQTNDLATSLSSAKADCPVAVELRDPLSTGVGCVPHFAIRIPSATPREQRERLQQALEQTHSVFYEVMARAGFDLEPLAEPLEWRVFADRSEYDRYAWRTEGMALPDLDSYYSSRTNRVAILICEPSGLENRSDEGRPNLTVQGGIVSLKAPKGYVGEPSAASLERAVHEAAHQLAFNSGLQKRGVMYPFWVAEGLATGFETGSRLGPGAVNLTRCKYLLSARRKDSLAPLSEFLVQVHLPLENTPRVQESYGQAWAVFHYLFTRHPDRLRRYLRDLAQSSLGWQPLHVRERQVAAALGPLDELEAGWQSLLSQLEAKSQTGGSPAAVPSGTLTQLSGLNKDTDSTQAFDQHGN